MNIEQIAKVAHEVNRAYCQSIGDPVPPTWEEASEAQRTSMHRGVVFRLANPDAAPSANHESWYKQKVEEGWEYGEVKDEVAKTHPCFLPYDQLPTYQKAKDYIFAAVVNQLREVQPLDCYKSRYALGDTVVMRFGNDFVGQIIGVLFALDNKTPIYSVRRPDGAVTTLSENEIEAKMGADLLGRAL